MNILTGNDDVPHRECISSVGMGTCLTGNAHPHRERERVLPEMLILTGNDDVPHRECTFSPGMRILTANAHSLYRVNKSKQSTLTVLPIAVKIQHCLLFSSLISSDFKTLSKLRTSFTECNECRQGMLDRII